MAAPIITVQEGQLRGKISHDYLGNPYYSYLGIPYGKAPVGKLRFKAPQPAESWDGIRDATKEGAECPARHMLFIYQIGAEDNCLNLNIYTKKLPDGSVSLKPVMVWIHGGGFLYGSNRSYFYGPDYLITENIVLVCINYRLGVLGFLSLDDPSLEVPGNAGMKDMILALKWLQKNIKSFGGDPNNVTIFGESAGSASVQYLCLSPMSKGLFHKAIAQSGSSLNSWARGCSNGLIIAQNLGYKETDERKILEFLRKLSPRKIVKAQHKTLDPFNIHTVRPFGPIVEKNNLNPAFLREEPLEIIKSGKFHQVPLIMGYTSREGMLSETLKLINPGVKLYKTINFEDNIPYKLNIPPGSAESIKLAEEIKKFYYGNKQPSDKNVDSMYLLKSDTLFLHGIHTSVSYQKLVSKSPIYFYKMTLDTPTNLMKTICTSKYVYLLMSLYFLMSFFGDGIITNFLRKLAKLIPRKTTYGTCHADDIGFLFKTVVSEKVEPGSAEEIHVKRFVKLWTNFAQDGNPTPGANDSLLNIKWKPVSKQVNYLLNIGHELKIENDPDSQRMKFWSSIM